MFNVKLNHIMLVLFSRKGCAHSLCTASQPMALTKHRVALEPGHKCSALKYAFQCQAAACFVTFLLPGEHSSTDALVSCVFNTELGRPIGDLFPSVL